MIELANEDYLDNSLERESLRHRYNTEFGGYRPRLEGSDPNQLPNTGATYFWIIMSLLPAYILSTGLFILFLYWETVAVKSYTFVWLGLLILFVVLMVFWAWWGSIDRLKRERIGINLKEQRIDELNQLLRKEQEAADELLRNPK